MNIWGSRSFQQLLQTAQFTWEPALSLKPRRGNRSLRLVTSDGKIFGTIVVHGQDIIFPKFLTLIVGLSSEHVGELVSVPLSELTKDTLRQRINEQLRV